MENNSRLPSTISQVYNCDIVKGQADTQTSTRVIDTPEFHTHSHTHPTTHSHIYIATHICMSVGVYTYLREQQ